MRPNIVTFLFDDMGFSDLGCFGGEIETPSIDALASGGFRATQFYNTARCCPARASLLTGLYPHQAGIGMMVYRDYGDGYRGGLNDRCVTLAEVLKDSGYQTMLSGKWHAGHQPHMRPETRGFERFTGIYTHVDSYWKVLPGCEIYRDGELLMEAGRPVNPYNSEKEFYTTDFFTDTAIDYIDQAAEKPDIPFFLHVCHNAPHFPLEAPDHLIEKYRGRYLKGWDRLKEEKLERMKAMGIVGPGQKMTRGTGFDQAEREGFNFKPPFDTEEIPKWDEHNENQKEELDFRRAMYAAQIERLDENIGRVTEHLKKKELLDNTLILIMSDNGCSGELGFYGMNWSQYRISNYEEWRTRGGWSISQGQCWASLSNTPLRKYKIFVHEGGIGSPFIAHWPKGISEPGRICSDQTFHLIDIMPTLCDVAGAVYPEERSGRRTTPVQGRSMVPWLTDSGKAEEARTLYWQHEVNAAIRQGNWKLVTSDDRKPDRWELYDLTEDRSESDDLSGGHPQRVEQMKDQWQEWAENSDVLPWPEERGGMERIPWPPK
ncbi:MAG: arylsulfatase [Candidatus Poribacteria bacterium]|nr:arylsulfatase [Candidatus Poribacteria bacterium]MDP6961421.1 arylsulfatase [Dehalococcoidia bacterium]